jgi:hypothetical protein
VDGGVVDQDIKAAIAAVQVGGDLLDAGWVGDVEAPGQHAVPAWERGGGPFGLGEVAGGEHDGVATQGQLPRELVADAAVGAGDEHDACHRTALLAGTLVVICGPPASEQSNAGLTAVWCRTRPLTRCGGVP